MVGAPNWVTTASECLLRHRLRFFQSAGSAEPVVIRRRPMSASKFLENIDVGLPGVGEDGMPGRNEQ
jgi:hypothetical protein